MRGNEGWATAASGAGDGVSHAPLVNPRPHAKVNRKRTERTETAGARRRAWLGLPL
jgi:hypothetical protein